MLSGDLGTHLINGEAMSILDEMFGRARLRDQPPSSIPSRAVRRVRVMFGLAILGALTAGSLATPVTATAATGDAQTVNAMAPLYIHDYASDGPQWRAFVAQLETFQKLGGDAISVDVWWGAVQQSTPDHYDWTYYDKLFAAITGKGLDIVPIMSFHQCGGNVGDAGDCSTPIVLPDFVWQNVNVCGIAGCTEVAADNWYISEYGNQSKESVAPWGPGSTRAYGYMHAFMDEFEARYSAPGRDYRNDIQELNISAGPAGELRYPSYNSHDSKVPGAPASYPNRGVFQSYTASAIEAFRTWAVDRYGSVAGVGAAWGIPGLTRGAISPPTDHERFITSGAYWNGQYGRDFTQWYSESLLEHGRSILRAAVGAFDDEFSSVPLGIKTSGVHWQTMASSSIRRAPEIAAGLIHTNQNYNNPATSWGYDPMLSMIRDVELNGDGTAAPKHRIVLHYTALEKPNLEWDGPHHAHSASKDQVGWLADAAAKHRLLIKGENALNGGLHSSGSAGSPGWSHIRDAFDRDSVRRYYGLTVLRLADVTGGGTAQSEMESFIRNYR